MAMGKTGLNAVGGIIAAVIVAGGCFGIALPVIHGKSNAEKELTTSRQLGDSYTKKLTELSSGVTNPNQGQSVAVSLDEFKKLVPGSMDIESASRAIASALPDGVQLTSFNFGSAQPVTSVEVEKPALDGFKAPQGFGDDAAAATTSSAGPSTGEASATESAAASAGTPGSSSTAGPSTSGSAAASGFTRIPFTIAVSAKNYDGLSDYINSLSDQPRLLSVISVSADRSDADAVSATVYAYAFVSS